MSLLVTVWSDMEADMFTAIVSPWKSVCVLVSDNHNPNLADKCYPDIIIPTSTHTGQISACEALLRALSHTGL